MSEPDRYPSAITRRGVLQAGALASAGFLLQRHASAADAPSRTLPLITKPIPSSGQKLAVIGVGTNAYGVSAPEALAMRLEVLRHLPQLGGSVVDTAPAYGTSEAVIGDLVAQLGNRNKLFLATKVTARDGDVAGGKAMLEESFKRLKTQRIDLVEVHNLQGVAEMIPVLLEMKAAKRIRYVGITTSNDAQHEALAAAMRQYPLDFIQVNYSLGDRESGATILPLAQERKIAVLLNVPFGGRRGSNLFARVKDKPPPGWAADFDATTWAHVFLKYAVSHPAVTCAIPGTTKLAHLEDNQQAARGRLPDAAMRGRIEKYWDGLA